MNQQNWRCLLAWLLPMAATLQLMSQSSISLDSALAAGVKNHPAVKGAQADWKSKVALKGAAFDLPSTVVYTEGPTGQFYTLGIQQNFQAPQVYLREAKLRAGNATLAERQVDLQENEVIRDVAIAYLAVQYVKERQSVLAARDSVCRRLQIAAQRRYDAGDADLLEKTSADAFAAACANQLRQVAQEMEFASRRLQLMVGMDVVPDKRIGRMDDMTAPIESNSIAGNTMLAYYQQNLQVAMLNQHAEKSKAMPGFYVGYMNQGNRGDQVKYRFQAGITVPIAIWAYDANIKAASLQIDAASQRLAQAKLESQILLEEAIQGYEREAANLQYYESSAITQAERLVDAAARSYEAGTASYTAYMQATEQSFGIKLGYVDAVYALNQWIIQYQFLTSKSLKQ